MIENFSKEELNNEQWKDIFGYDGAYQVSDLGRVRSKKYGKTMIRRASKDKDGYLFIGLWKDGKQKTVKVHRLVAQAFIHNDNIFNNEVNHKDENKENNRVDNLEWCTSQYNKTYNNLHNRRKPPKPYIHHRPKQNKLKDLYNTNLTYEQNIELFKTNGIECSEDTIWKLRRDLGLTRKHKPYKRKQID